MTYNVKGSLDAGHPNSTFHKPETITTLLSWDQTDASKLKSVREHKRISKGGVGDENE